MIAEPRAPPEMDALKAALHAVAAVRPSTLVSSAMAVPLAGRYAAALTVLYTTLSLAQLCRRAHTKGSHVRGAAGAAAPAVTREAACRSAQTMAGSWRGPRASPASSALTSFVPPPPPSPPTRPTFPLRQVPPLSYPLLLGAAFVVGAAVAVGGMAGGGASSAPHAYAALGACACVLSLELHHPSTALLMSAGAVLAAIADAGGWPSLLVSSPTRDALAAAAAVFSIAFAVSRPGACGGGGGARVVDGMGGRARAVGW